MDLNSTDNRISNNYCLNCLIFNSLIFIYSEIQYITSEMSSYKVIALSHHDHHTCPQFCTKFSFYLNQTVTKHESIYIWPACQKWQESSIILTGGHAWTFLFDKHFHPKILAEKETLTILHLPKIDNEIINTYSRCWNLFQRSFFNWIKRDSDRYTKSQGIWWRCTISCI